MVAEVFTSKDVPLKEAKKYKHEILTKSNGETIPDENRENIFRNDVVQLAAQHGLLENRQIKDFLENFTITV